MIETDRNGSVYKTSSGHGDLTESHRKIMRDDGFGEFLDRIYSADLEQRDRARMFYLSLALELKQLWLEHKARRSVWSIFRRGDFEKRISKKLERYVLWLYAMHRNCDS